ncbi:MerR family transcriptional regulator [Halomonas sp. NyZ770]|uniref:MerR family transcriptional regulator n=1 Tax=Halomonas sp. NyZ770 TaxID=2883106 RepID=UPI001D0A42FB|nr:MerR family transcriptional regulator [Halomonas sp. NyZ770]UDM06195.1 MerR family transcriptional regulator [Halomonas sp. NyZ770]WGL63611.1 MerR family transcriptional regulator [Pseudomonas sp. CW003PS]
MRIGELARLTGSSPENIRFYEREGLLPAPERSSNNYRQYGQAHVERLHQICSYRALGIGLDEMRSLLDWAHNDTAESDLFEQALQEHLARIEERIEQLTQLKEHLLALRERRTPRPHKYLRRWC